MEAFLTISLWWGFFYGVNYLISVKKRGFVTKVNDDKFNNIATSLFHAILSAAGAGIYPIYQIYPIHQTTLYNPLYCIKIEILLLSLLFV